MEQKIFKFGVKEYTIHSLYKYLLGWFVPTLVICLCILMGISFNIVIVGIISTFNFFMTLIVWIRNLRIWRKASVEISNNSIQFTTKSEGYINDTYNINIFIQTALSIETVKKSKNSIKVTGIIQKYKYKQMNGIVKEKHFEDNTMIIPLYFSKQEELINEIKKLIGDNYYE